MEKISIYDYPDFAAYLAAYVKHRKTVSPAYSYAVLARQIGSKSPSLLTQIGLGRRIATPSLLHKLKSALKLSKKEYEYALALVGVQRAKTGEERTFYVQKLRAQKPSNPALIQELDRLDFFGRWYNVVILEMLRLKGFHPDPAWIAARLGHKITAGEAAEALALLERLELLKRQPDGTAVSSLARHAATPIDFPSATIRSFHKQMMHQAIDALDTQGVSERYIAGTTIVVHKHRIAEAQAAIRDFRQSFCEEFQADAGDESYHFAVQLFGVTTQA